MIFVQNSRLCLPKLSNSRFPSFMATLFKGSKSEISIGSLWEEKTKKAKKDKFIKNLSTPTVVIYRIQDPDPAGSGHFLLGSGSGRILIV